MYYFKSKKLIVALGVVVVDVLVGLAAYYGVALPLEPIAGLNTVALGYLGGQSFVDAVLAYKGVKKA